MDTRTKVAYVEQYVRPLSPRDRDWIGDVCCLGDELNDGMAALFGHGLLYCAL